MIILPKEEPVVVNLNSYFLVIEKLVEHYQGEVGTGCIYFKAPSSEAAIFFDEANLINSYYYDKKLQLLGNEAFNQIINTSPVNNFSVSVFHILPERLYFWANQAYAEILYSDLNSEFTDIEGLIHKLEAGKHSGSIEIKLNKNSGGGILFLFNGLILGGVDEKGDGTLDRSVEFREKLFSSVQKFGAVFNVKKIQLNVPSPVPNIKSESPPEVVKHAPPDRKQKPEAASPVKKDRTPKLKSTAPHAPAVQKDTKRVLEMLEALLYLLERVIQSNRKLKVDFDSLLNKKFAEKAEKYDFLDPFFDEFRYVNGRIEFKGQASSDDLVAAITECVREIVVSLGIIGIFRKFLESWKKGFANEMIDFDIEI
jgi:hypothetical protein